MFHHQTKKQWQDTAEEAAVVAVKITLAAVAVLAAVAALIVVIPLVAVESVYKLWKNAMH